MIIAMSKFRCKCLNLTVHVKEKATREADGKAFVAETCTAAFFDQGLYEVELAIGGITKVSIPLIVWNEKTFWNNVKTILFDKTANAWRAFCFSQLRYLCLEVKNIEIFPLLFCFTSSTKLCFLDNPCKEVYLVTRKDYCIRFTVQVSCIRSRKFYTPITDNVRT